MCHSGKRATYLPLLVVLIASQLGCARLEWRSIWSLESPNGSRSISLMRDDRSAFSSFSYKIVVENAGDDRGGTIDLWSSYGCQPVYIFWLNDAEIEVVIDPRDKRCSETKTSLSGGLSVRESPLLERSKISVLGLEGSRDRGDGSHPQD